ncbi:MAG: hypothetical protein J6J67_02040 [Treponema sp.]|nr:hypothetical protein [Treponema sp.]
MKLTKKVLGVVVSVLLGTSAFAQRISIAQGPFYYSETGNIVSNTRISTVGLYYTDVDNFMSVTRWNTVKPETFFGHIGYEDELSVGFAKQFKDFYIGTSFVGQLDGLTSTTTNNDGDKTTTTETSFQNAFNAAALFGFGNMAFKATAAWNNADITNTKNVDGDVIKEEIFNLNINLENGFVTKLDDKPLEMSFLLGLDSSVNKTVDETADSKTDNSTYTINVGSSALWTFDTKEKYTQEGLLHLYTSWAIPSYSQDIGGVKTKRFGIYNNSVELTPEYRITLNPTERLSMKAGAALPFTFAFEGDADYAEMDGNKSYNTAREENVDVEIQPMISLGMIYQVLPEKVNFNMGIEFATPSLTWDTDIIKTRTDTSSKDVDATSTTTEYNYNDYIAHVNFGSGFTVQLAKTVTFDCYWNILSNLFGTNFESDLTEDDGINFWNTVNKIFVHNIGFSISAKF